MKDLYEVTLNPKQIAQACEDYVFDRASLTGGIAVRVTLPPDFPNITARVSKVRKSPAKKVAE